MREMFLEMKKMAEIAYLQFFSRSDCPVFSLLMFLPELRFSGASM